MNSYHKKPNPTYEIQIMGELDRSWEPFFDNFSIKVTSTRKTPITTLVGSVADQPALRGLLCKLWDLNLTVISLRLIEAELENW